MVDMPVKIIIVDDHDLFRGGLCRLLETDPGIEIAGNTGKGRDVMKMCREAQPDIVLLDIDLPDIDGMDLSGQIIKAFPAIKIIMLTMYDNEEFAVRALQSGVKGYIYKGISPADLPDAINQVHKGGIYVTPSIQQKIIAGKKWEAGGNPLGKLTDREISVLKKLAQGRNSREIAEQLCLSVSTIKYHRKNIFKKLGLDNIADLVKFAIRYSLIDNF